MVTKRLAYTQDVLARSTQNVCGYRAGFDKEVGLST
jgi:hypothetical protein